MNLTEISTIELADKVLPFFNDHDMTNMYKPFLDSGISEDDIKHNQTKIHETLNVLKNLRYIEAVGDNGSWKLLTEIGRKVKSSGGHFSYLKNIEDKVIAETERQKLNDEKLKYDVKNAKRIFKTYWWTFGIAIAGFAISLVLAILKVIEILKVPVVK